MQCHIKTKPRPQGTTVQETSLVDCAQHCARIILERVQPCSGPVLSGGASPPGVSPGGTGQGRCGAYLAHSEETALLRRQSPRSPGTISWTPAAKPCASPSTHCDPAFAL